MNRRANLNWTLLVILMLAALPIGCDSGMAQAGSPVVDPMVVPGGGVLLVDGALAIDLPFLDGFFWNQGGNAGTSADANFLGTTDFEPLEMRVNNTRALRIEPTASAPNIIGGAASNAAADGTEGVAIGGGESNIAFDNFAVIAGGKDNIAGTDDVNNVSNDFATVGGGFNNVAAGRRSTIGGGASNDATGDRATIAGGENNTADRYATVGGGQVNRASGFSATIGGGTSNEASGEYATVAGGQSNEATADNSTVSGGRDNRATGLVSMVPGGFQCWAEGFASFAAGYNARAVHRGAFVWADTGGLPVPFSSTGDDQFLIRAAGGVGINTDAPAEALHVVGNIQADGNICATGTIGACSDRRFKQNVSPLADALETLAQLRPVSYDWKRGAFPDRNFSALRQTGFIAQEIQSVMPEVVGEGADGYLFVDYSRLTPMLVAAMRELRSEKDAQIARQREQIETLTTHLQNLEARLQAIETERDVQSTAARN